MIRRCAYCHSGQVLQIGEAYALKIASDWIDANRCNQYVLCPCVVGYVVRDTVAEEARELEQDAVQVRGADAATGQPWAAVYANEEYW